ncbi:hydantoinase B/oxoprolinase family protein [Sphingomonas phyllosphaerae]|uniref:hydantoinase B/oxoprolinase family protein n=1 Tax=Sphingomonas phyllosphaerae TaxID=257003 RepID=UPI0024139F17|nr:hydantoinase B/oxoprolinase family protein [Sphingomonas phyllosphaerae]
MSTASPAPLRRIAIDRGGTFTDVVAERADGTIEVIKLLSVDPGRYDDAAVEAVRRLTGVRDGALPPLDVRIGTTVATNALLERRGEPVLLAITRGFGDALAIGYQDRPDIFARAIVRPPPLPERVVEIDERVDVDGALVRALDLAAAERDLRAGHDAGLRAVAIVLMHGWRYPAHEAALEALARAIGFTQISVSHRVAPLIRLVARGDTTAADAYLSPVLRRYVDGLEAAFGGAPLFMQSSGGLAAARAVSGKDALLSGPAGGIVGMAAAARAAGVERVIGFDMGGTSTDVSLWAGTFERRQEAVIGGVRVAAPMLRIDTVAAGGGSICGFDGGRFTVGPESAGADPGPASYRRGGPLTVTDCNLLLGKIVPEHFPAVFGPGRDQPLDRGAARTRLEALLDTVEVAVGTRPDPLAAAEGLVAIAVANMAKAIKSVSVARGHDPASYALMSFGGAGGQHACLVADALGMRDVLIHPLAGVLSAWGIALADRRAVRQRTVAAPLDAGAWRETLDQLAAAARAELDGEGTAEATVEAVATLRYARTDQGIEVSVADAAAMRAAFEAAHRERFGFTAEDALIVERLQVEAVRASAAPAMAAPAPAASTPEMVMVTMAGAKHEAPLHRRESLGAGARVAGPALLVDATSTVAVEPGWEATVLDDGSLRLTRVTARAAAAGDAAVDPVRLAIFAGLFMGLAEEMGSALQRSAASVNIRERLDFSCALFDAGGHLVANAPHIPVHLGSMGDCVRHLIASRAGGGRGMRPGDAYAVNDPYRGGTHLPDITVVQPVFAGGDAPAFFVAARGHHADVGGTSPGSMPADSRTLADEGVVFDDVLVLAKGRLRGGEVRALFASGPHPARTIDQNMADLAAQLAACARGAAGLERLVAEQGREVVAAYMEHVQAHAETLARGAVRSLSDGAFAYATDDGAEVCVAVRVDRDAGALTVDFTGTSAQRPGNTNAPLAVTRAAVLYVLRTLVAEDTPLNDGFLRPVTLIVPEGSMLNPRYPAAVVAGNVETSQVVTDALMGALGAMAASQGTMNNFTFGDSNHQYYETIAGGAGAGDGFAGASAVQTHMTNSRLTDPEVLETRFPVLLETFAIRRGSGGGGRWPGGDGALRRVRFRAPMRANILSNHRVVAPFGLAGGGDGAVGANRVERADGRVETLGATASVELAAGDVVVIETPGGGGYGGAA